MSQLKIMQHVFGFLTIMACGCFHANWINYDVVVRDQGSAVLGVHVLVKPNCNTDYRLVDRNQSQIRQTDTSGKTSLFYGGNNCGKPTEPIFIYKKHEPLCVMLPELDFYPAKKRYLLHTDWNAQVIVRFPLLKNPEISVSCKNDGSCEAVFPTEKSEICQSYLVEFSSISGRITEIKTTIHASSNVTSAAFKAFKSDNNIDIFYVVKCVAEKTRIMTSNALSI